jgi:hypothetical protein
VFAPFALADGGPEAWRAAAREFGRRCVERWASVCTNMDDGLSRRWAAETPHDISQKMINYRFGDWMVGVLRFMQIRSESPRVAWTRWAWPALAAAAAAGVLYWYVTPP